VAAVPIIITTPAVSIAIAATLTALPVRDVLAILLERGKLGTMMILVNSVKI
jgi:hypothetical protein